MGKTKQSDAFKAMAEKVAEDGWSGDAWAVGIEDAVKLLCDLHGKMVRMVNVFKVKFLPWEDPRNGYEACENRGHIKACDDILVVLDLMGCWDEGRLLPPISDVQKWLFQANIGLFAQQHKLTPAQMAALLHGEADSIELDALDRPYSEPEEKP